MSAVCPNDGVVSILASICKAGKVALPNLISQCIYLSGATAVTMDTSQTQLALGARDRAGSGRGVEFPVNLSGNVLYFGYHTP